MRYARPIERLIKAFSLLPGIGEKSAARMALFILNSGKGCAEEIAASLYGVKDGISLCSLCMAFSEADPCAVCSSAGRDSTTVCVVSDFKDMVAIESSDNYRGTYHILHGNLAPLKGVGPDEIRIKELLRRAESNGIKEVILATGFDAEGEATSSYIAGLLRQYDIRLTRLASGIPVGSYVEFMDPATLSRAMEGRRAVN